MGAIRNSLFADASATLLLRLLTYVSLFASTVVASRALGPDGRGTYFLVVVTATTLATVAQFGLPQANVYLRASCNEPVRALGEQNALAAIASVPLSAAFVPLAPIAMPGLFADVPPGYLILGAATVPIFLHTQLTAGLQLLEHKVTWAFAAALVGGTTHFALLGGLAAAGLLDVSSALSANLVALIVTWLVTIAPADPPARCGPSWNPRLLRETIRHSLMIHVGMVLLFLHLRVDVFLLKGIAGTTALGIYSLAVVLAETVMQATDGLSIALVPRQLKNTIAEAGRQVMRMGRLNILTGLLVAAAWIAAGWLAIPWLFGEEFSGAYLPLLVLLPGMIAFGVQRLTGPVVLRSARSDLLVLFNGGALGVNVALDLLLLPTLGPVGAATASSVSYVLSAALFVWWTMRVAPGARVADLVPRRSDIGLLADLPRRAADELASRRA